MRGLCVIKAQKHVMYLSIFSSQVKRGPKVVVSRMRVRPTPQQHRHHLSVTTGTCYVEL